LENRNDIRNVAIIAHVDHGKTTLVDAMLKQSGIFRANEQVEERVMDSNDLERERGITILSKNTAINYKGIKINIVDTPGHADFGGEVERVLGMVDGVLLLVDAFEGPMPQTKFVLRKALALHLKPIVVINKIDRPDAEIDRVVDEVLDLFIELGADDDQLDFPVIYTSARKGVAHKDIGDDSENLQPLFDMIINQVPSPYGEIDAPVQMMVTNLDYDDYVGRIVVGRIIRGKLKTGQTVNISKRDGQLERGKIGKVFVYEGLGRKEVQEAVMGDIVSLTGLETANIGETVTCLENPEALPILEIDEPTLKMTFSTNNSPFAGKEGEYVTSRHLRDRLFKELESNVSLRVTPTDSPDAYEVAGRGELHLSILIETMRREGYEFQVSKPEVIFKKAEDGSLLEPIEYLTVDIPEEFMGVVMEMVSARKGEMINMHNSGNGQVRLEFQIPARGLIGFRSGFLTETKGYGIMNNVFHNYSPYKGEITHRQTGVLVASETGETNPYGLYNSQERGKLFVGIGEQVYEGMIVGENPRNLDIEINVCKKKHITNMRASGSDETLRLTPPVILSLEQSLEYIADDELVEITPKNIRLRKRILDTTERARATRRKNS